MKYNVQMHPASVIKPKINLNDVNSIEHTIGIIKPEGMNHAKKIIGTARKKGFRVLKVILMS